MKKTVLTFCFFIYSLFLFSHPVETTKKEIRYSTPASKYQIYGTVTDDGVASPNTMVELHLVFQDAKHPYKSLTAVTDKNGNYHFNNGDLKGYYYFKKIVVGYWDSKDGKTYTRSFGTESDNKEEFTSLFEMSSKLTFEPKYFKSFDFDLKILKTELRNSVVDKDPIVRGTVVNKKGKILPEQVVELTLPYQEKKYPYKKLTATINRNGYYYFNDSDLKGYDYYQKVSISYWNDITKKQVTKLFGSNNSKEKFPLRELIANGNFSSDPLFGITQYDAKDLVPTKPINFSLTPSYVEIKTTRAPVFSNYSINSSLKKTWVYDVYYKVILHGNDPNFETIVNDPVLTVGGKVYPLPKNIATDTELSCKVTLSDKNFYSDVDYVFSADLATNPRKVNSGYVCVNGTSKMSTTSTHYLDCTIGDCPTKKVEKYTPLPLPEKVVVGYAHSWDNPESPFMYFRDMIDTKYNVIIYSFIQTKNQDGFTPYLLTNDNKYLTAGVFDKQLLKDDIQSLREKGIPVLVSIGGANGYVSLITTAQKDTFVAGLKSIIDEYHFDGIDIDFEGAATMVDLEAENLTDFSYNSISAFPGLKNVVDAFKEIKTHYGTSFILTAAPKTFYVQRGFRFYDQEVPRAGLFLPILHNLRNELDLVMVQLYNTDGENGLDNVNYKSATPDFLVSMSDMLTKGFNVGTTGFHFDGLPASKIVIGIPACPSAAGQGYITPTETIKALDYLRFGITYPGKKYTLQPGISEYSDIRGVMTWSVNWDAVPSCASAYEFSNAYSDYFSTTKTSKLTKSNVESSILNLNDSEQPIVYPNPFSNSLNISLPTIPENSIGTISVSSTTGQIVFSNSYTVLNGVINIDLGFLPNGLYVISVNCNGKVFKETIVKQ